MPLRMLLILTFIGCFWTPTYAEELGGNVAIGISHGGAKYWFHGYYKSYVIELPKQEALLVADKRAEYEDGHEKLTPLADFRYSNVFARDNSLTSQYDWLAAACGSVEKWPYPRIYFNKDVSLVACLSFDEKIEHRILTLFETNQRAIKWRTIFTDDVEDVAWNPSGQYIVVLFSTSRVGLWPHELIFWLVGHPVPYNSFYVAVIDSRGNRVIDKIKVASGLKGGRGIVVWFDKSDKSLIGK